MSYCVRPYINHPTLGRGSRTAKNMTPNNRGSRHSGQLEALSDVKRQVLTLLRQPETRSDASIEVGRCRTLLSGHRTGADTRIPDERAFITQFSSGHDDPVRVLSPMIAAHDSFRLSTIYTLASTAVYRCCTTHSPMSRFRPYDLRQQTQGSPVLILATRRVTAFSDQLPTVSVPFTRD